jgi:hypothetical protein
VIQLQGLDRGDQDVIKLRNTFALTEKQKIYFCHSVAHAVSESVKGLAQLYPHKTQVIIRNDTGPFTEFIAEGLSRDGLQVLKVSVDAMTDEFLAKHSKSTLLLISDDDDVITGEKHFRDDLEEKICGLKVFSLRISHTAFELPPVMKTHSIWIRELSATETCMVLGERVTFERLLYPFDVKSKSVPCRAPSEDKVRVMDFESKAASFAKCPLLQKANRWFDRGVLIFSNLDGSALREKVLSLDKNIASEKIETSSLCRWSHLKGMDWLENQGFRPEDIRGLVTFSSDILNDDLLKKIEKAKSEILKLQDISV